MCLYVHDLVHVFKNHTKSEVDRTRMFQDDNIQFWQTLHAAVTVKVIKITNWAMIGNSGKKQLSGYYYWCQI